MSILASKQIEKDGFIIVLSITDLQCGMNDFHGKWSRDINGLIKGSDGDLWDCNYFSIGQLNKGNDCTVYQAQKEFNRDCKAFDVSFDVKVLKNNIELTDQCICGTDYNYDDCTELELLENMQSDHFDIDYHINEAKEILKDLLS